MSIVLLLGGRLTAGKDEVADHLVRKHGFTKIGMSDTLAEALYRLNPIIPDWPEVGTSARYSAILEQIGYVEAKKVPEVRRLLQVLGTEVGRELLGENIWVDAAARRIRELLDEGKNVALTGIRFPNELALEYAEWGSQNYATSVWVDRLGLENTSHHASEGSVAANSFQYVLTNDKDLQALYTASSAILEEIRKDYGV